MKCFAGKGEFFEAFLKKIKKVLAFFGKLLYDLIAVSAKGLAAVKEQLWLVGQAVKTSPSHGENRGSIPLRAVDC